MLSSELFFLVFALGVLRGAASAKSVLLVVADDAGLEAPAFGNDAIRTPHIDELASKGVRFDNAFTSVSSCSPRFVPDNHTSPRGVHYRKKSAANRKIPGGDWQSCKTFSQPSNVSQKNKVPFGNRSSSLLCRTLKKSKKTDFSDLPH